MSPEKRAIELIYRLEAGSADPVITTDAQREAIASAIREAQASARNEALEEAAAHLLAAANVPALGPITIGDEMRMQGAFENASAIRTLKTKD